MQLMKPRLQITHLGRRRNPRCRRPGKWRFADSNFGGIADKTLRRDRCGHVLPTRVLVLTGRSSSGRRNQELRRLHEPHTALKNQPPNLQDAAAAHWRGPGLRSANARGLSWLEAGSSICVGRGWRTDFSPGLVFLPDLPHRSHAALRLLSTHIVAAQILSLLWVRLGELLPMPSPTIRRCQGTEGVSRERISIVYGAGCVFYLLAHLSLRCSGPGRYPRARDAGDADRIQARDAELKALKAQINRIFCSTA